MNTLLTGQLERSSLEIEYDSEVRNGDSPYSLAVRILGDDFIPPELIAETRGFSYDESLLGKFRENVPSEATLNWCHRCGFILVAGPPTPMSILEVRRINPLKFHCGTGGWYDKKVQNFSTTDRVGTTWLALRKEPVLDSEDKTWSDQVKIVRTPIFIPNIAETMWGLLLYDVIRSIRLDMFTRTSSIDNNSNHVIADVPKSGGLHLAQMPDGQRSEALGVIAARRFLI